MATKQSRRQWLRFEGKVSVWLQGWTLLVVVAFLVKMFVAEFPWWCVAAIAGSHTGLYIMLIVVCGYRHKLEILMAQLDRAISGGDN